MANQPMPSARNWRDRIRQAVADSYRFDREPSGLLRKAVLLPFYAYARLLRVTLLPTAQGPCPRVLDIGCGSGHFLCEMKAKGWQPFGVEPVPDAARRSFAVLGPSILTTSFEPGLFSPDFFDLVTMWHVLEHLPNPLESIKEINRVLKPGGHLVAMLPNIASVEFQAFRGDWQALDLPRHLYHFSPQTLRQALRQADLDVLHLAFQIEPATLEASLRNLLDLERRDPGGVGWLWLRRALWCLSFLLAQLRTSGTMMVYARKRPA